MGLLTRDGTVVGLVFVPSWALCDSFEKAVRFPSPLGPAARHGEVGQEMAPDFLSVCCRVKQQCSVPPRVAAFCRPRRDARVSSSQVGFGGTGRWALRLQAAASWAWRACGFDLVGLWELELGVGLGIWSWTRPILSWCCAKEFNHRG